MWELHFVVAGSPECGDYKLVSQRSFNVGSYTESFVVAGSPERGDYKLVSQRSFNVGATLRSRG